MRVRPFLSTPSGWRATAKHVRARKVIQFLSTPSGWRATGTPHTNARLYIHFYPRPPGGGRHLAVLYHWLLSYKFLSTPSGWRATSRPASRTLLRYYFYPRPPGGGRLGRAGAVCDDQRFLSTPSGWRATFGWLAAQPAGLISIHALRVEGDRRTAASWRSTPDFYPRPPGGGRLNQCGMQLIEILFLSTPSGWRATDGIIREFYGITISIHALRVEGDPAAPAD